MEDKKTKTIMTSFNFFFHFYITETGGQGRDSMPVVWCAFSGLLLHPSLPSAMPSVPGIPFFFSALLFRFFSSLLCCASHSPTYLFSLFRSLSPCQHMSPPTHLFSTSPLLWAANKLSNYKHFGQVETERRAGWRRSVTNSGMVG